MSDLRRIIWLASFPKSGNTWLRSLLAHYFMPPGMAPDINNLRQFTTADIRQDFFDAANGGPFRGMSVDDWLRVRTKALHMIAGAKPGKHFVKTHCTPIRLGNVDLIPPSVTAGALYIMRNPFDVAPSFARHTSVSLDEAIAKMCDPENVMGTESGILDALGRWDDHVTRWATVPGMPRHLVRYEDLLDKPAKSMERLLDFLSVKPDRPKLAKAIKATSFEAMKKQEEKHGFTERPEGMKSFFAKGKAGGWKDDLTPAQVGRIREEFAPVLERWYPEMLDETAEFAKSA
ncbi:Sulfotransferase domain protein [Roseovarius sp. THAF9]|uniref:sulfotransferase domain-containing protein n=1 Tax=Roseovarius sp. THAF9 TaxID=2587847 RepID=UPI0012679685|nr:sulfotransferase domain-containing protein [Roseovarius sp. THAF9]QFT93650.1 Sulfotransferase domain protein [Roseovarius sp. THAF9]